MSNKLWKNKINKYKSGKNKTYNVILWMIWYCKRSNRMKQINISFLKKRNYDNNECFQPNCDCNAMIQKRERATRALSFVLLYYYYVHTSRRNNNTIENMHWQERFLVNAIFQFCTLTSRQSKGPKTCLKVIYVESKCLYYEPSFPLLK